MYISLPQKLNVMKLTYEIIPQMRREAELSNDQMAFQEVNDMAQFLDRLEKRLYDLQLSRQITIQSAPQIRMIQQTNQTLAEKIQSSIMTSIPLWKNQIAIALTLNRQKKAVESQKLVTKTTNDLLLKNSEMLKMNSIETAKENERGIIEIDTLKKTQENLIQTIEETLLIQADGREKRKAAEIEIGRMEEELKQRLLAVHEKTENRSLMSGFRVFYMFQIDRMYNCKQSKVFLKYAQCLIVKSFNSMFDDAVLFPNIILRITLFGSS